MRTIMNRHSNHSNRSNSSIKKLCIWEQPTLCTTTCLPNVHRILALVWCSHTNAKPFFAQHEMFGSVILLRIRAVAWCRSVPRKTWKVNQLWYSTATASEKITDCVHMLLFVHHQVHVACGTNCFVRCSHDKPRQQVQFQSEIMMQPWNLCEHVQMIREIICTTVPSYHCIGCSWWLLVSLPGMQQLDTVMISDD